MARLNCYDYDSSIDDGPIRILSPVTPQHAEHHHQHYDSDQPPSLAVMSPNTPSPYTSGGTPIVSPTPLSRRPGRWQGSAGAAVAAPDVQLQYRHQSIDHSSTHSRHALDSAALVAPDMASYSDAKSIATTTSDKATMSGAGSSFRAVTASISTPVDESRHTNSPTVRSGKRLTATDARQRSNSSDEAVAPSQSHSAASTTRILSDELEALSTRTKSLRAAAVVFENLNSTSGSFPLEEAPPPPYHESSSRHKSGDESNGSRSSSHRSNVGLTYALRRTDSGSTFQSLDGLSNAYPLIRKEARRRKEEQRQKRRGNSTSSGRSSSSSSRDKRGRTHKSSRKRPTSASGSNHHRSSSSRGNGSRNNYPMPYSFDTSTLSCFPTSAWFPLESFMHGSTPSSISTRKHSPSLSNLQYQEQQQRSKLRTDESNVSSKQLSTREELLRLKLQLRELRRMASPHAAAVAAAAAAGTDTSLSSNAAAASTVVRSPSQLPPHRRRLKEVRFAAALVTQVTYRPYTEPDDIALLYFQEEELEALECDREEVSGDQFECQFDEAVMTVRIAYQKHNPADE